MVRWMVVAMTSATVIVSGCSPSTPTVAAPAASKPSSSTEVPSAQASPPDTEAAGEPLGGDACVEITQANLDLATASDAGAARKAGDAFAKYDLPAPVKEAVEHFVGTGGAQFDDPQYDKFNNAIENWIKRVCPL